MNRNSTFALALLLLVMPLHAAAASHVALRATVASIRADDSVAGLGTDIAVEGLSPGEELMLVVKPPQGPEAEAPLKADRNGSAHARIAGNETEVAGIYTASLEDTRGTAVASTTFEILPDSLSAEGSTVAIDRSALTADGRGELGVTATLRDRFSNPLPDRMVTLIGSRSGDHITPVTHATDKNGDQRFTVRTREPGTVTLRAMDFVSGMMLENSVTATAIDPRFAIGGPEAPPQAFSQGISRTPSEQGPYPVQAYEPHVYPPYYNQPLLGSVLYDPRRAYAPPLYAQVESQALIDHFEITAPEQLNLNEDATIRIIARDRFGNKVDDYVGTVLLSSTDPEAYLPLNGTVPFQPQNLGEKILTLGLRFRSTGEALQGAEQGLTQHTLRGVDSQNPNVSGQVTILVRGLRGSATGGAITITSPREGELVSGTEVTIEGTTQPFINLIAHGGTAAVEGDSNVDGNFAMTVRLDPESDQATLSVSDELEQRQSQKVTVRVDARAPVIDAITFSPQEPVEGAKVVMTVETEQKLPSVTASIADQTLTLTESDHAPGSYEVVFTAPEGDVHRVEVTAEDEAGNSATETALLTVGLRGLPVVQNLTGKATQDEVTLQWDPVTSEPVEAYRIYVGRSAGEFEFTLDTNIPTNSAQVAGLNPATSYSFAVTALQGKRESIEKSNVLTLTTLGLRLDVVSQDSSLLLDWSSFQVTMPLASFILEYGVQPQVFIEKRILSGDQRTYVLHDLINEVQYYLELTPVAVTGEILRDWSAAAKGTPHGTTAGFRPMRAKAAPPGLHGSAPPDLHRGAPSTTLSGAPTWVWLAVASAAALALMVWWQRRKQLTAIAGFVREMERQYSSSQ